MPPLQSQRLLQRGALLTPEVARTFICHPFEVPAGTQALRVRLSFAPARSGAYKNLLTISLFDPQGFRGAGHRHAPDQEILIGRRGATPGFVPGPLPVGQWLAEVDCHCVLDSPAGGVRYTLSVEGVLAEGADEALGVPVAAYLAAGRETVVARAEGVGGAVAQPEYEPDPHLAVGAPDSGGAPARWLKGDLHVHSRHSDARWSNDDIVRYVQQNRLDFIAVTDHNTNTAYDDARWSLRSAGLETVVIPAMELTTFWGHANALGVRDWIDWRVRGLEGTPAAIGHDEDAPPTKTMAQAADEVHRLGGTFVVNHPRSGGYPGCTGCRWDLGDEASAYTDALEVWNGPWDRAQNHEGLAVWNRWLNSGHRVPATAGSDSHDWPRRPHEQGFTYVLAEPGASEILSAVRAGRSYVSSGPRLTWLDGGGRVGAFEVEVGGLDGRAELRLVHNGEAIDRQPVRHDGHAALGHASSTAARSGWYRAELWRPDSTILLALTNPVYTT